MKKLAVLLAAMAAFAIALPSAASASIDDVFDAPDTITCGIVTTEGNVSSSLGQRWCGTSRPGATNAGGDNITAVTTPALPTDRTTVQSFDGVPIDVNVAFPSTGGDGPYPLVMMFHGYGGQRMSFASMQRWLDKGYAVYSQTNRGFHESCGSVDAKAADPDCTTKGFVRLDDTRYEVRDAQLFAGMLADEGLILPTKIAATGGSYGGGMSMALAALKNRTMLPDGTLVPWKSPDDTAMSLAVAVPEIPWSDLSYSLVPNGSTLDYLKDASYTGPFGVMKQSYVNGLYFSGLGAPGYYTAAGVEPEADLAGWKAFMDAGEPYNATTAQGMMDEIQQHHSSYYIDHSQAPAPLLISSGMTDDLFPVNEAVRFYNRTRAEFPGSPVGLTFGDFGHPRAANKSNTTAAVAARENDWVDYYLSDVGSQPSSQVTVYSQTCPSGAAADGPYNSPDWASASPGEIDLSDAAAQTISAGGGTRAVGLTFNPTTSGTSACSTAAGEKEPGTANYELAPAPAGGYTVLGSPTVIARYSGVSDTSQIAARLVDVSADGTTKTLVNRALWRPADGFQVFQLNANSWKVEEGHVLRLELLSQDAGGVAAAPLSNYGRPSNGQTDITVTKLELRVPVLEAPGALGGLVKSPAKKVLPPRAGAELAPGYESTGSETLAEYGTRVDPCPAGTKGTTPPDCAALVVGSLSLSGKPTIKGKLMTVKVTCKIGNDSCSKSTFSFKGAPKGKSKQGKGLLVAKGAIPAIAPGSVKSYKLKLTSKARKFFRDKVTRKKGKKKVKRGPNSLRASVTVSGKSAGFTTIKRVGKVK